MKKYFLLALVAFASIALVSCKKDANNTPDGGTSSDLKVVVNPKTSNLIIGGTAKLRASVTPAKEGITFKFESSNAAVASVDADGIIKALAEGTANIIVSAEGATADTCVVTVSDPYNAFAWGGMGLFDASKKVGEPYEDEFNVGTLTVQNYLGVYYLWDDNIDFENGVGFSGAGYVSTIQALVGEIVSEGEYKGQWVFGQVLFSDTLPENEIGCLPESALPATAEEWYKWLTDSTYEIEDLFIQSIDYIDFDAEEEAYYLGYIHNGWVEDSNEGFYYNMNIDWFDADYSYYYLKIAEGEDGKWDFVKPYEYGDHAEKNYKNYSTSQVAGKTKNFVRSIDLRQSVKAMQQINKMQMTKRRMK